MKNTFFVLLLLACNMAGFSQLRLATIGSSTTAGTGAFPADSSYVKRLEYYYKTTLGIVDKLYNMAVGGYTVYAGMPTSYTPPGGRPGPIPPDNVTSAVDSLRGLADPNNGVIIVNFPTNGFVTFTIPEIMARFQTIYDSATRLGNKCYITTSQPRSDAGGGFNTSAIKRKLWDIKDSILNRFGVANTLNFYDGMYNPVDTTIRADFITFDSIHYNNAGHRELFQRVVAKNIFGLALPVKLQQFTAQLQEARVVLKWSAEQDDPNGSFTVQRSEDGQHFESLQQIAVRKITGATQYEFTDPSPLPGISYYRLAIEERGQITYSKITTVKYEGAALVLKKMYPNPADKWLQLEIIAAKKQTATLLITNNAGIIVQRFLRNAAAGTNRFSLPVQQLPHGLYFMRMITTDGHTMVRSFTR